MNLNVHSLLPRVTVRFALQRFALGHLRKRACASLCEREQPLRCLRSCARVYVRASVTRSPQFRAGAARPSACARPRPRTQQQSIKFCTGFRDIQHTLSQWITIAQ